MQGIYYQGPNKLYAASTSRDGHHTWHAVSGPREARRLGLSEPQVITVESLRDFDRVLLDPYAPKPLHMTGPQAAELVRSSGGYDWSELDWGVTCGVYRLKIEWHGAGTYAPLVDTLVDGTTLFDFRPCDPHDYDAVRITESDLRHFQTVIHAA